MAKKIVFCDLDGTLIDTYSGSTFPKGIWDMKIKFDVWDKIKEMKPTCIFIVTNQGGLGKFVSVEDFESKLFYITNSIKEYCGVNIVDCVYCSSVNKEDELRKPNTGMLRLCIERHGCLAYATLDDMVMIGDASGKPGDFSDSDKKCAENFSIDYIDVRDLVSKSLSQKEIDKLYL